MLAELVELVPGGVEEDRGSSYVEFAIYGPPGELPELPDLEAVAGEAMVEIAATEIPDDWADRWKAWHRPVDVAWRFRRLRVRPPWEEPLASEPSGVYKHDDGRPMLGRKLKGKSEREMKELGLSVEKS